MDPTGFAEAIVALINHKHVKTGISLILAYLGATMIQWSIGDPMPQEGILIAAGGIFLLGGGAYALWRIWDE